MNNKFFKSIGFKIMSFYILLSLINLSFVISIIFENQVDLIGKNIMLESEKQLSQLLGSMKKFTIESRKGKLFNVKDEKDTLSQLLNIISMHYRDFIVFSDKDTVIFKSSSDMKLPDSFKEDALRSLAAMAFSGKEYYLRLDSDNSVIIFYIPLNQFMHGENILLVKKNIGTLNKTLADLYKQAFYIIFVVFFFHMLFAVILYKSIIHPIRILDSAAKKLTDGELGTRVSVSGRNNELDSLAASFNRMADSINENVKSLSAEIETVKAVKHKMEKTDTRDELTGLLNDKYMNERIGDELSQSRLHHRDISLILVNLDDFNRINGIYGTQTGDIMLKETARKIAENCSGGDIIARFGGEEFAVLSPQPSRSRINDLAESIRASMDNNEVVTPDGKFRVTVSIGVSYFEAATLASIADISDVVESAKSALRKAKSSGKNRVEFNS